MADQTVKVILKGEDQTGDSFKVVGTKMKGLQTDVSGLAKTLAGAGVAVGGLAVAFGVSAVKSAGEAEKGIAQLNAVLKSTSNAAGLFAEDILDQASALEKMTTFSDDAILSAQNLLLTFTNVKGPVFQESIGTILDMSQALGQDLKSSAIQVGKALNDPIQGITALSRVGVNFTEQQKQQIETLVQSGKTMEAQKLILAELGREFGGSATAAAETFEGKILQMNNQIDNLKEIIGGALITAIQPFIEQLTTWAMNPDVQIKMQEIAKSIGEFATVAIPVAIETMKLWKSAFDGIVEVIGTLIYWVDSLYTKIMRVINAFGNLTSKAGSAVNKTITGAVSELKFLTGARASGGPVLAGGSYLVGEQGPEIFTPQSSGMIFANGQGGGGLTINISGNTLLDKSAGEIIARQIMDGLKGNLRI